MQKFLILPLALVLVGGGCSSGAGMLIKQHDNVMHVDVAQQSAAAGIVFGDAQSLVPGSVTLAFTLVDAQGNALTEQNLKIAHEKLVHLILVRDDLGGYQHLHPDYRDGAWTVTTDIPRAGRYVLYADVQPVNGDPVVLRTSFAVGGETIDKEFPGITEDWTTTSDSYSVQVTAPEALVTNNVTHFTYSLQKSGEPVATIDPYLGAYGHLVVLKQGDPGIYLHAHAMTEAAPTDGQVTFMTTFESAGTYTLFAQFNVDGAVHTFPVTVEVTEGSAASSSGAHHDMH